MSQLPDGVKSGVTNLDTIDAYIWDLGHGYVPEQEDVKWLSSNNLHFTSPFLNNYYAGQYDDNPADYPISTRDWGFLPEGVTTPTEVENVPPVFINEITQTLIDDYSMIIAENNYDNTLDPLMHTKGIASQEVGDVYAKKAMKDYGVMPATMTWTDDDKNLMAYGDRDPATFPGIETEDGGGFATVTDLIEDFSYDADVVSTIDARPLGSLQWFPNELASYDAVAALANIKNYMSTVTSIEKTDLVPVKYNLAQNYPNPFNPSTVISYTLPKASDVKLTVFNMLGQKVQTLVDAKQSVGKYTVRFDASELASGVYFYQIQAGNFMKVNKMLYVK